MPSRPRTLISAAIVLSSLAAVLPSHGGVVGEPDNVHFCHPTSSSPISKVAPGPTSLLSEQVVNLTSNLDGAQIHMALMRPKLPAGTRAPVIVFATPYLFGSMESGPVLGRDGHKLASCVLRLTTNYISHGYAIGYVAVRGSSDSGGCSDLMGDAERADLDQAITWFGSQSWSNGRVGMVGVSYDGSTPWEVASMGNKYLKTIVPISGVNDEYQLMYRNGAPESRGAALLNEAYYQYGFVDNNVANGRSAQRVVDGAACPEAATGFAAAAHSFVTGERDPFGFWAERNSRPRVEQNYKGSIFMVQGLQDWNVDPGHNLPWARDLERKGFTIKYLLSQGGHMWPDTWTSPELNDNPTSRWDWATVLLRWWDRWLKNDTTVDTGPKAQVQDSMGRWRNETSWPPARATAATYYLRAVGTLSASPAAAAKDVPVAFDPYRASGDGRVGAVCPACPAFTTGPFTNGLRFAGFPTVSLTVVPTGPGYVSAWLQGVAPDGSEKRVGWGMVDLRFPNGGEVAQLVTPGEALTVRIPIEPLDVSLPAGWRLKLVISQGGFGDGDHVSASPPVPMQLHVGDKAGLLAMSTFTVPSTQFFKPPRIP